MEAITECVRKARCIRFDIGAFALFFKKKKTHIFRYRQVVSEDDAALFNRDKWGADR